MTTEDQPRRTLTTNPATTNNPPMDMQERPKKVRPRVKLDGNRAKPISSNGLDSEIAKPAVKGEPLISGLQKKERFEDLHNRVTTYINKEHHEKLKEVRITYRIAVSETINTALTEYFRKHNL